MNPTDSRREREFAQEEPQPFVEPGSPEPGREELLKRLRSFRGRLPADFKFDRDKANAG